jgi:hypothetical protein
VAYFYFDFENTAVIVSDKRACTGLQELQALATASGGRLPKAALPNHAKLKADRF